MELVLVLVAFAGLAALAQLLGYDSREEDLAGRIERARASLRDGSVSGYAVQIAAVERELVRRRDSTP